MTDDSRTISALDSTPQVQLPPKEIVLLLHGIRTFGWWQPSVARVLAEIPGVEVRTVGYEYLDVFSFLCPFFTRGRAIEEVRIEIQKAQKDLAGHPNGRLSVIAHSFGTYIITRLLWSNLNLQLYRLVLCGSIVPRNFEWHRLQNSPTMRVINDYGTRDIWPVLAKCLSWGYGDTGRHKFGRREVIDRAHDFGHSDFFTGTTTDSDNRQDKCKDEAETFIRTYWLPWFKDDRIVPGPFDETASSPWWLSALSIIPIQWIVLMLFLTGIVACSWEVYSRQEAQKRRQEQQAENERHQQVLKAERERHKQALERERGKWQTELIVEILLYQVNKGNASLPEAIDKVCEKHALRFEKTAEELKAFIYKDAIKDVLDNVSPPEIFIPRMVIDKKYDAVIKWFDDHNSQVRTLALWEGVTARELSRTKNEATFTGRAIRAFTRALHLTNKDTDTSEWVDAAISTAYVLWEGGRWLEADALLRESRDLIHTRLGDNSPHLPIVLGNLGMVCRSMGQLAEAEQLLRQAYKIYQMQLTEGDPLLGVYLNAIGAALIEDPARWDEAENLITDAYLLHLKAAGPNNRLVGHDLNNRGRLRARKEQFNDASTDLFEALRIAQLHSHEDQMPIAIVQLNLGYLFMNTNRLEESERQFVAAEKVMIARRGTDSPQLANMILVNRAALLIRMKRHGEAEVLLNQAVNILEQHGLKESIDIVPPITQLARVFEETDRAPKAEALWRRALRIDEAAYGHVHSYVARDCSRLGHALQKQAKWDDAGQFLRRAVDISESLYGKADMRVETDLNNWAEFLMAAGRNEEADEVCIRLVDMHIRYALQNKKEHEHSQTQVSRWFTVRHNVNMAYTLDDLLKDLRARQEHVKKELASEKTNGE